MINWHRIFGLFITDYFYGSPYEVEVEKDLSLKRQYLDVVVVRKRLPRSPAVKPSPDEPLATQSSPAEATPSDRDYSNQRDAVPNTPSAQSWELADGFDNLKDHNLISYKSLRESFDEWALLELIGHYVNYRKQVAITTETQEDLETAAGTAADSSAPATPRAGGLLRLLPPECFQLYAVCTRFPQKLSQKIILQEIKPGVYDANLWDLLTVRFIVLSRIDANPRNAILRLFSGQAKSVLQAQRDYHVRQETMTTAVQALFNFYREEARNMAYTMDDFLRDYRKEFLVNELPHLSPDEILDHYPRDMLLNRLSPEDLLSRLTPEDRLKDLSPEDIANRLSPEQQQRLLAMLTKQDKYH